MGPRGLLPHQGHFCKREERDETKKMIVFVVLPAGPYLLTLPCNVVSINPGPALAGAENDQVAESARRFTLALN